MNIDIIFMHVELVIMYKEKVGIEVISRVQNGSTEEFDMKTMVNLQILSRLSWRFYRCVV